MQGSGNPVNSKNGKHFVLFDLLRNKGAYSVLYFHKPGMSFARIFPVKRVIMNWGSIFHDPLE